MAISREVFLRQGEPVVFEVGYRTDEGCDHVYVPGPDGGHLEFITRYEMSFDRDGVDRVETRPDFWYDVDGATIFAREIGPYKQEDATTNRLM